MGKQILSHRQLQQLRQLPPHPQGQGQRLHQHGSKRDRRLRRRHRREQNRERSQEWNRGQNLDLNKLRWLERWNRQDRPSHLHHRSSVRAGSRTESNPCDDRRASHRRSWSRGEYQRYSFPRRPTTRSSHSRIERLTRSVGLARSTNWMMAIF